MCDYVCVCMRMCAYDQAYNAFGGGDPGTMDNVKFAKLAREAGLANGPAGKTDIDIVFSRVKLMGERRIGLEQFEQALLLICTCTAMFVCIALVLVRDFVGWSVRWLVGSFVRKLCVSMFDCLCACKFVGDAFITLDWFIDCLCSKVCVLSFRRRCLSIFSVGILGVDPLLHSREAVPSAIASGRVQPRGDYGYRVRRTQCIWHGTA
jgi:hypothetical protein